MLYSDISIYFIKFDYYYNCSEDNFLFQVNDHPKSNKIFNDKYPFYTHKSNYMVSHFKDYFNWISKFRDFWPMSKFPIVKQKIFYGGINIFPARSMDFFNRRIDFHLRYNYQIKPLLKHSNTIINRGRKISDYLLDILHM